jgi:hypothetical protein
MQKPRQLKLMGARDEKLGRPTIMDRALAQRYGTQYVYLAAFAIDVDRVRAYDEEGLPFAWEVYLTEAQLKRLIESAPHDPVPMLEEMCLAIFELPRPRPGEQGPLGSQLPFAIYTAIARGILPAALGQCFASWKKPPVDLIDDVRAMEGDASLLPRLARHCLGADIQPPLIGPVREALTALTAIASEQA